jgi:hypothetical protein
VAAGQSRAGHAPRRGSRPCACLGRWLM